eukprot:1440698-Rhodomonas_salina.2
MVDDETVLGTRAGSSGPGGEGRRMKGQGLSEGEVGRADYAGDTDEVWSTSNGSPGARNTTDSRAFRFCPLPDILSRRQHATPH